MGELIEFRPKSSSQKIENRAEEPNPPSIPSVEETQCRIPTVKDLYNDSEIELTGYSKVIIIGLVARGDVLSDEPLMLDRARQLMDQSPIAEDLDAIRLMVETALAQSRYDYIVEHITPRHELIGALTDFGKYTYMTGIKYHDDKLRAFATNALISAYGPQRAARTIQNILIKEQQNAQTPAKPTHLKLV